MEPLSATELCIVRVRILECNNAMTSKLLIGIEMNHSYSVIARKGKGRLVMATVQQEISQHYNIRYVHIHISNLHMALSQMIEINKFGQMTVLQTQISGSATISVLTIIRHGIP
jgi:hypothetical protein